MFGSKLHSDMEISCFEEQLSSIKSTNDILKFSRATLKFFNNAILFLIMVFCMKKCNIVENDTFLTLLQLKTNAFFNNIWNPKLDV